MLERRVVMEQKETADADLHHGLQCAIKRQSILVKVYLQELLAILSFLDLEATQHDKCAQAPTAVFDFQLPHHQLPARLCLRVSRARTHPSPQQRNLARAGPVTPTSQIIRFRLASATNSLKAWPSISTPLSCQMGSNTESTSPDAISPTGRSPMHGNT